MFGIKHGQAEADFSKQRLGSVDAILIANDLADPVTASITSIGKDGLNFKGNRLGNEGWGAIFAAVCSSEASKITSVDASGEKIGPEGAKLIGQALRNSVNTSVTSVRAAVGW